MKEGHKNKTKKMKSKRQHGFRPNVIIINDDEDDDNNENQENKDGSEDAEVNKVGGGDVNVIEVVAGSANDLDSDEEYEKFVKLNTSRRNLDGSEESGE